MLKNNKGLLSLNKMELMSFDGLSLTSSLLFKVMIYQSKIYKNNNDIGNFQLTEYNIMTTTYSFVFKPNSMYEFSFKSIYSLKFTFMRNIENISKLLFIKMELWCLMEMN